MGDGECVKVIVRCRPMNQREKDLNCKCVVTMDNNRGQCTLKNPGDAKAPPKMFTFDGAYFTESTTEQIYSQIGYPLVEGVTEGYNGTIFAYGQTGCGKSFSMQGIPDPPTQRGIIPRSFDHIFETVSVTEGTKFLIHASYCEIYNEEIRDLLGKDIKAKLELKEHPEKGVYVNGLSLHPVHNVMECEKIMAKGWTNRATGATLMNADSSRSHSIFSISLEMSKPDEEGEDHIRAGKLNLVDLAGSERQSKTGATGDRLKEATKINLSLSALGNVISALVDGKSKHIPYRDSKLTRLLQDSLGGNTKTLMVACLSPADNNYEETLSTLRYANRAKNIQNKPKINEDPKDALLREYQQEIEKLKAMLMGQIPLPEGGFQGDFNAVLKQGNQGDHHAAKESRSHLEAEKERLKEEYDAKLLQMKEEYEVERGTKNKLEQDMIKLRAFYDGKLKSVDGKLAGLPSTAAVLGEIEWNEEGQILQSEEELDYDDSTFEETYETEDESKKKVSPVVVAAASGKTIKIINGKQVVTKTEEGTTESPRDRPSSVMEGAHPAGPDVGVMKVTSVSDASEAGETEHAEVTATIVDGAPVLEHEGLVAPSSSPTQTNMQENLKLHQEEALRRLQELEAQMVGGENINNKEVKERHKKRKLIADEQKQRLAEAIAKMDDDFIMLQIYDNVQDELKVKNQVLENEKNRVESLERDIIDIQSEFQFERIDYLDTIRQQEKQLLLLQGILDKIHPCLRRDCNYFNLDRIKMECKYDEEENKWILPRMLIQTTALPVAEGVMPGGRGTDPRARSRPMMNGDVQASMYDNEEDRFRDKLMRKGDKSQYFESRRQSQLLNGADPANKINMMEIKQTYAKPVNQPVTNGYSNHDDVSNGLRAAQVHGALIETDNLVRRPTRLEALPTVGGQGGKKSKKKRNGLDPL